MSFRLQDGSKGGATTYTSDIYDLINYISMGLMSYADLWCLFSSVCKVMQGNSIIAKALLTPLLLVLIDAVVESFNMSTKLYFNALQGSQSSAETPRVSGAV